MAVTIAGTSIITSPLLPLLGLALVCAFVFLVVGVLYHPFWILLFLVAFLPFEEMALKFLPANEGVRFVGRYLTEILLYSTALALFLRRIRSGWKFHRSPLEMPLLLFVGVAILSIVFNQAPLLGSFVNLRALLRYVVIFYLVLNMDLSHHEIRLLINAVLGIAVIQIGIGAIQILTDGAINSFLLPASPLLEVGGISRNYVLLDRGREIGSIFGTLGDTILFAAYMLVMLTIFLGRFRIFSPVHILFVIAILLAANFAYARAVVFAMLLALLILFRLRIGQNRTFLASLLVIPFVIIGLFLFINSPLVYSEYKNPAFSETTILENLTGVFTVNYVEHAQAQRLGALLGIPPTVLANEPLLGYGPDELNTIKRLNESYPNYLVRTVVQKGFEDVYWVAMLAYYGIFGVFAFAWLLFAIFRSALFIFNNARDRLTYELSTSVICLVGVTPFLLFFDRVLEFRGYSFYFWLVVGLAFASSIRHDT